MTEAQGERDRSREVAEREGLRSYRNRRREKRVVGKTGGGEEDAVVREWAVPPRLTSGGRAVQPISLVSVS